MQKTIPEFGNHILFSNLCPPQFHAEIMTVDDLFGSNFPIPITIVTKRPTPIHRRPIQSHNALRKSGSLKRSANSAFNVSRSSRLENDKSRNEYERYDKETKKNFKSQGNSVEWNDSIVRDIQASSFPDQNPSFDELYRHHHPGIKQSRSVNKESKLDTNEYNTCQGETKWFHNATNASYSEQYFVTESNSFKLSKEEQIINQPRSADIHEEMQAIQNLSHPEKGSTPSEKNSSNSIPPIYDNEFYEKPYNHFLSKSVDVVALEGLSGSSKFPSMNSLDSHPSLIENDSEKPNSKKRESYTSHASRKNHSQVDQNWDYSPTESDRSIDLEIESPINNVVNTTVRFAKRKRDLSKQGNHSPKENNKATVSNSKESNPRKSFINSQFFKDNIANSGYRQMQDLGSRSINRGASSRRRILSGKNYSRPKEKNMYPSPTRPFSSTTSRAPGRRYHSQYESTTSINSHVSRSNREIVQVDPGLTIIGSPQKDRAHDEIDNSGDTHPKQTHEEQLGLHRKNHRELYSSASSRPIPAKSDLSSQRRKILKSRGSLRTQSTSAGAISSNTLLVGVRYESLPTNNQNSKFSQTSRNVNTSEMDLSQPLHIMPQYKRPIQKSFYLSSYLQNASSMNEIERQHDINQEMNHLLQSNQILLPNRDEGQNPEQNMQGQRLIHSIPTIHASTSILSLDSLHSPSQGNINGFSMDYGDRNESPYNMYMHIHGANVLSPDVMHHELSFKSSYQSKSRINPPSQNRNHQYWSENQHQEAWKDGDASIINSALSVNIQQSPLHSPEVIYTTKMIPELPKRKKRKKKSKKKGSKTIPPLISAWKNAS